SVTFFRSMGGTIGAAVFLSILFSRLPAKIASAYTAAAKTPAFQQAAAAHPEQLKVLQSQQGTSAGGGQVTDTSFLNHLEAAISHPFKVGFAGSMSLVYYIAAAVMLITLAITLLLPEIPLSRQSAQQRRGSGDATDEPATPTDEPAAAAG
ncbi:MAG TPA: MFS transporter, partial [Micromonosporaceae bacterium]